MYAYFNALVDWLPLLQLVLLPIFLCIILGLIFMIFRLRQEVQRLQLLEQSQPIYPPPRPSLRPSQPLVLASRQPVQQAQPGVSPPESEHGQKMVPLSSQSEVVDTPQQSAKPDQDGPLDDKQWVGLVEGCVGLYDELDRHFASLDPECRALAEHVLLRLQEILGRSNVEVIAGEAIFDRHRHQPEQTETRVMPGAVIAETLRPGFAVGHRVLRRARVRLVENTA